MKRVTPIEYESLDFLNEITKLEAEAKMAKMDDNRGPVFVIVCGSVTGLFNTYEQVKDQQGHTKGHVYVKFNRKRDAQAWFDASLKLPRLHISANEVYVSARNYDVSQDHDVRAAVAIYFGPKDPRNVCLQATTRVSQDNLHLAIFEKMLSMIPSFPVRVISDCYKLVYGINYGLWLWPKHTICAAPTERERKLESMVKGLGIELKWQDKKNHARVMAKHSCVAQYENKIPNFVLKQKIERCVAWILCAKRMGLPRDVRRIISRLVYRLWDINDDVWF